MTNTVTTWTLLFMRFITSNNYMDVTIHEIYHKWYNKYWLSWQMFLYKLIDEFFFLKYFKYIAYHDIMNFIDIRKHFI